jgi:hypothetical protein
MGDTLYFKVNDANRGDYEARGMGRFRPYPNKPHLSMTYYEVPADVLEDADECAAWARRSVAIAGTVAEPATPTLRRQVAIHEGDHAVDRDIKGIQGQLGQVDKGGAGLEQGLDPLSLLDDVIVRSKHRQRRL